jgi:hypothetical protein
MDQGVDGDRIVVKILVMVSSPDGKNDGRLLRLRVRVHNFCAQPFSKSTEIRESAC